MNTLAVVCAALLTAMLNRLLRFGWALKTWMSAIPLIDSFSSPLKSRDVIIDSLAACSSFFKVKRNRKKAIGASANESKVICQLNPNM